LKSFADDIVFGSVPKNLETADRAGFAIEQTTQLAGTVTQRFDLIGSLRFEKLCRVRASDCDDAELLGKAETTEPSQLGGISTSLSLYRHAGRLYGERITATAAALGLRILDDESLALKTALVIEDCALQVDSALGI